MDIKLIKHRGDKTATKYTIRTKEEADRDGIKYVYWQKVKQGQYALTDDDIVAKCYKTKDYGIKKGIARRYFNFPFGPMMWKTNRTQSKCWGIRLKKKLLTEEDVDKIEFTYKDELRNLALAYAITWDKTLAIAAVIHNASKARMTKLMKQMKSQSFRSLVTDELNKLLTKQGLGKEYTFELFKRAIEMAIEKKDVSNMLKAVENLQKLHGFDKKEGVNSNLYFQKKGMQDVIGTIAVEERNLLKQLKRKKIIAKEMANAIDSETGLKIDPEIVVE